MVKNNYLYKLLIVMTVCAFLFSLFNNAYGMDFNDDIQKVTLGYYYYEGFGDDKVVQSIEDGSWHILKPDGSLINLKGNYLAYAGMEGKNLNFDDDYYRFVIGNESYHIDYSSRFIYVDKNGLESFVDGYTYVDSTKGENYFVLINIKGDGYETGLYHKYNKTVVIPTIYDTLNYINDDKIIACKNGSYGLMNIKQEEIIPFEYNYLTYINDNFIIAVNEDGKYGVININNEVLLTFEYDEISDVYKTNEYFIISKNDKFSLVKTADARIVIPFEYDNIEYPGNELAIALHEGRMGVIDVKNKVVVPFAYDYIMYHKDGFIVLNNELHGFLNKEGKIILPAKYFNILEIKDGFITAVIDYGNDIHKYAVYDMNGKEIVPPIYDHIDYYATDKYMIAKKGWYAYFIDKKTGGEVLENTELQFTDIKYINDKYYAGGSQSSYAIINYAGQRLTLESYNDISIINVNGEDIIAAKYNTERFNTYFDYFKQTNGPSTWAKEEVAKAVENNLVPFEYQASFTFNIKRYEFCSIMVAFLEEYYNTTKEDIIRDNKIDVVNPPITDGFSEDIAICLHLGIVNGRGNGIFDSESEITREEAAVMLTNLAKYLSINTNTDEVYLNDKSVISSWAMDAVNFALQNKIMQGTDNNTFSPKSNLTREQTYIIMYRSLNELVNNKKNKEAEVVASIPENKIILSAVENNGIYENFTLEINNNKSFYNWKNVSSFTPELVIKDINNDEEDELIIILQTAKGTGVNITTVYVIGTETFKETYVQDPIDLIYKNYKTNITGNQVEIIIGDDYKKIIDIEALEISPQNLFTEVYFNNIIQYEVVNDELVVRIGAQISPAAFIGEVQISYVLKGDRYEADKIKFVEY